MCPAAAPAIRRAMRLHPLPAGGAIFQGTEISLPQFSQPLSLFLFFSPRSLLRAHCGPGELRLDATFSLLQRTSGFPPKMLVQCNECFYKVPADLCRQRYLPCWVELVELVSVSSV